MNSLLLVDAPEHQTSIRNNRRDQLLVQNLISISTHFCCHIPSVEILYGYDRSLGTISVTLNMKLIMLILKK